MEKVYLITELQLKELMMLTLDEYRRGSVAEISEKDGEAVVRGQINLQEFNQSRESAQTNELI